MISFPKADMPTLSICQRSSYPNFLLPHTGFPLRNVADEVERGEINRGPFQDVDLPRGTHFPGVSRDDVVIEKCNGTLLRMNPPGVALFQQVSGVDWMTKGR